MNNAVSIGEPWMWAAFIAFVLVMLALDLFVFGGRKAIQDRRQVGVELQQPTATGGRAWLATRLPW
jgi:hypothetical protein